MYRWFKKEYLGQVFAESASRMTRGMRGIWAEAVQNKLSEGPW